MAKHRETSDLVARGATQLRICNTGRQSMHRLSPQEKVSQRSRASTTSLPYGRPYLVCGRPYVKMHTGSFG